MRLAWLNSETIKTMLTVIAIPLALAYLSHRYEETTAKNQAADARLRLYTELLTSREQADSGLRKDMFGKVLDTFMTKRDGDVDQQLVELELLAANFQDSLNLSPLFRQLRRQIDAQPAKDKAALMERLESVASDVKARQIEALELVGAKMDGTVNFAQLDSGTGAPVVVDKELSFSDPGSTEVVAGGNHGLHKRHFHVEAMEWDKDQHRLLVQVHDGSKQWVIAVDPFDFPLVDYTRISNTERFTVAMTSYSDEYAQLKFIYFPSSRSGVSDKPYIDQVLASLRLDH
jgi:hypothetical protein